jgi:type II secretion system protein J
MTSGSTMKKQCGDRGFTLMELLIATLVAAVVLAAMNAAFYAALHLRSSLSKVVEENIPLNYGVSILKADLRGVLVTGGAMASAFESPGTVIGSARPSLLDICTTTGVLNDQLPWGDMQRVSYYLKDPVSASHRPGKDLIRAVTRNLLAAVQPDVTEQTLLSGVDSLNFTFYDGSNWQTSWDTNAEVNPLPQAIKAQIQFARVNSGGQAKLPIELVVPVDSQMQTNSGSSTGP